MSSNNSVFYFQFLISLIALGFSATMLVVQKENNNIYLPFLTSIVFAWIPSPINTQNQNIKNSDQEIETDIDTETESQKLMLNKNKNKNLTSVDNKKNIELETIHIDKIDETNFMPIILRKDI
jgi:hypothetical protein